MKSTQLSTRVDPEDASFLNSLVIEGASTSSDKLRALIGEARRRREDLGNYSGSLRQIRELIGPVSERILQVEHHGLPHSELVTPMVEWLTETLAFVLSEVPDNASEEEGREAALHLESGLADRVFQLVGSVLRLGVTHEAQCYEPTAVSQRLKPVLAIAKIVAMAQAEAAEHPG